MSDPRLTPEVLAAIEALIARTRHVRFRDWLSEQQHPEYALRVGSLITMAAGPPPRAETPEERRARKPRVALGQKPPVGRR